MKYIKLGTFLFMAAIGLLEAEPRALFTDIKSDFQFVKMASERKTKLSLLETTLIDHVKDSISLAEQHISKLTPEILAMPGMSSTKNRCLLNNIVRLQKTNYLEIGTWQGSTLVSALYGNEKSLNHAFVIDNWSQFGGPYQEFLNNCKLYIEHAPLSIFSHDCFSLQPQSFINQLINVYFYDGGHTAIDQERAFTFYNDILDDVFICIVDDWNWGHARSGSFKAFEKLNYQVLYEVYLPANFNGDQENWWDGFYVAVIRK